MTCTVRHKNIVNDTNPLAPLPAFDSRIMINSGNDNGLLTVYRTMTTAEVGTTAGQTRDNTTPAAGKPQGLLFAQFQGASIQNLVCANIRKPITVGNNSFDTFSWGVAGVSPAICSLAWMVIETVQGNGLLVSSLYLLDRGDTGNSQIAVGDGLMVMLEVGNIPAAVNGAFPI